MIPIYFAGKLYEDNKKELFKLYEQYGVLWDSTEKAWIGENGKIKGIFEGYKKPALLQIEGGDEFVNCISDFCKGVGAEIREIEIKDIRVQRKEEDEAKERLRTEQKIETEKIAKEIEKSRLDIMKYKVSNMRKSGMQDDSIKWWLKKETGTELELTGESIKVLSIGEPDSYSFKDLLAEVQKKNENWGNSQDKDKIKKIPKKNPNKKRETPKIPKTTKTAKTGNCPVEMVMKGMSLACPDNCKYVIDGRCTWGDVT